MGRVDGVVIFFLNGARVGLLVSYSFLDLLQVKSNIVYEKLPLNVLD